VSATNCCRSYRSFRSQNAAVRVVTGARMFDHITPVLRELHWLPVCQRIRFKLAMMVYKCLHGLVPPYPADDCNCVVCTSLVCGQQTALEIGRHPIEAGRSANTNCYWRQRFRGLPRCHLELAIVAIPLRVSSLYAATFARHLKACLLRRPR